MIIIDANINHYIILHYHGLGFTKLTEKLAERGPNGAEELVTFLNEYFGMSAIISLRGIWL